MYNAVDGIQAWTVKSNVSYLFAAQICTWRFSFRKFFKLFYFRRTFMMDGPSRCCKFLNFNFRSFYDQYTLFSWICMELWRKLVSSFEQRNYNEKWDVSSNRISRDCWAVWMNVKVVELTRQSILITFIITDSMEKDLSVQGLFW